MNRRIGARVERLEQRLGSVPDLAGEAERYGTRLWSVPGCRAYGQDTPAGARLAVASATASLVYEIVAMTVEDLL